MILLGMVLTVIGLTGCGKSKEDYVGTYISTEKCSLASGIDKKVLEIRPDHTFEVRIEYRSDSPFSNFPESPKEYGR